MRIREGKAEEALERFDGFLEIDPGLGNLEVFCSVGIEKGF